MAAVMFFVIEKYFTAETHNITESFSKGNIKVQASLNEGCLYPSRSTEITVQRVKMNGSAKATTPMAANTQPLLHSSINYAQATEKQHYQYAPSACVEDASREAPRHQVDREGRRWGADRRTAPFQGGAGLDGVRSADTLLLEASHRDYELARASSPST